jgi:hypothetical protein
MGLIGPEKTFSHDASPVLLPLEAFSLPRLDRTGICPSSRNPELRQQPLRQADVDDQKKNNP